VVAVGADYLRIISWNFVASGLIFTCSGMLQGLGNTLPALIASLSRLLLFVVPALWLATRPGFTLRELWYLSVASVTLQAVLAIWLVRRELARLSSVPPAGVLREAPAVAGVAPGGLDG
jgi:Na+-driven multidrug efflux pump